MIDADAVSLRFLVTTDCSGLTGNGLDRLSVAHELCDCSRRYDSTSIVLVMQERGEWATQHSTPLVAKSSTFPEAWSRSLYAVSCTVCARTDSRHAYVRLRAA